MIERDGVWNLVGEYRLSEDDRWESGSAVCGFVGQEPNGYETGIMMETIQALRDSLKARCRACRQSV
jgi:hypothetical protein